MIGGVVRKWYKKEGDHVGYGDDLLEVNCKILVKKPYVSFVQSNRDGSGRGSPGGDHRGTLNVLARVTSSDSGILRKIESAENTQEKVGGVLAIFSTADGGSEVPRSEDLHAASEFRTVINFSDRS